MRAWKRKAWRAGDGHESATPYILRSPSSLSTSNLTTTTATLASREIILYCLLYGDEPEDGTFKIRIASTETVGDLRDAIKAKNSVSLAHIDAKNLQIWKVSIPFDDSQYTTRVKEYAFENENRPRSVRTLSSVFDDLLDEHLHVLVRGHEVAAVPGPQSDVEVDRLDGPALEKRQKRAVSARLESPPPSSSALATNLLKLQNTATTRILNGRPLQNHGLPVELYHCIFDEFRTDANKTTLKISPEDYGDVANLCVKAAAIYKTEEAREEGMYADLAKLLAQELKVRPASGPRCVSADRVIILEKKEMVAFLAVVEMKNEIGSGNCDPAAQASFSYAFYMAQPEMQQLLATSNCPCFLIAVAGPHIRILGAVFTDYVIVKPLTDWMQLDIDPADNAQLDRFARVLLALRTSLQSLAEHYQALKLGNTDTTFTRFFPHIRSYPVSDNGFVSFHYLEKLASSSLTKPVFKALTDKKEFIVVKFTQQYNTDAHRLLATNGLAPNLLYSGFDTGNTHGSCGSLKMVVMEFAEGKTAYDHDKELSVKQYEHVQNAVKILHDEGFVFGDLRLPNIMVDGETAKLIDFDWCAKEGTGRYPAVINDSDITWHTGVKRGGKMEKEHDDFMLLEDNMPHLLQ